MLGLVVLLRNVEKDAMVWLFSSMFEHQLIDHPLAEVQSGKSPGRCRRCGCSKNLKVLKGEDLDDI